MTLRQRIRFYQQLAVLVRAGVPLRASLLRLKGRSSGNEVAILSEKVEAGERVGEAFAAAGFSSFETHLVTAGERSAQLDAIFEHLSDYWTKELEMRQALVQPLYYPIAVLHLALVVAGIVEASTGGSLLVVSIHFVERLAFLYAFGFVVYTLVRVSWSSEIMRNTWLCVPIVAGFLKTAFAYRWITALRLEFGAGISLSRAVGDAWRASGYPEGARLAEEGEQAMRQGTDLSKLVLTWRQLPRDWVDFIETGEISGGFEAAFKNLEAEAARAWTLAQQRMADWLPKILYFFVLLIVAAIVGQMVYKVIVAPMADAEKQIDQATQGH